MKKKELLKILKTNNKSGVKSRETYIKKNFPETHKTISSLQYDNWYQKLYHYLYDINEIPKCKNNFCEKKLKFKTFGIGYHDYCSVQCRNKDIILIEKTIVVITNSKCFKF
jgi:hypothetical protein